MFAVKSISPIWIVLACLVGCGQHTTSNTNGTYQEKNSLQYFGFALVDCGWDDPNDNTTKTNYVDEISGFTNVAQMCVYSPDAFIGNRIYDFSRVGVKAVLNIEEILFERSEDASSPSGERLKLQPNAKTLWLDFVAQNSNYLIPDYIAALYVVDEPVWNGLKHEELVQAVNIVKDSLPNLTTFIIEAHPVVDQMQVPEKLDWIGFDRYNTKNPAEDVAWLDDLETVRAARTRDDQKIVVVASTQWFPHYQIEAGIKPEDIENMLFSYYDIASSDPDVIALAGYIWPGGVDHPAQLGARNLPENVKKSFRVIGEQILGE
ncbi:MAG: hypothetical protein P8163_04200 [Candidatus Thiodiazotropha sp.]